MTHRYKNPWYKPGKPEYGPKVYERETEPTEYLDGYLIYRIHEHHYDVVKDGVCITQRAGPRGARQAIEQIISKGTTADGQGKVSRP